jgi:hypothetical protein
MAARPALRYLLLAGTGQRGRGEYVRFTILPANSRQDPSLPIDFIERGSGRMTFRNP